MKKCDFCTQSDEQGKCYYVSRSVKEKYCKEAIKQMIKAMGKQRKGEKE